MHVSACTARPTSSPSFRNWRPPMPEPPPKRKPPTNQELIRAVWEEARDLVKRLEGSTVQRFSVEAGDTKIEIERRAGVVVAEAGGGGGGGPMAEKRKGGDRAAPAARRPS